MIYGDSEYLGAEKREDAIVRDQQGERIRYQINHREWEKSSVRAKVEHVFVVVKNQLRYRKTRYRGLRKQIAKLNIIFALADLILADRLCLAT